MSSITIDAFLSGQEQWAMQNYKWAVPKNKEGEAKEKNTDDSKIIIFLVDDDPIFSKALAQSISDIKGHQKMEIKIYVTGEECLSQLQLNPSIVILDYYLDSKYYDAMNGLKVLKKVKQTNPQTKVIILSGQNNVDVALDAIKYKAYDYVSKNENTFLRIRNIVEHIVSEIRTHKALKLENRKYMIMNIVIFILLLLFFVGSIFINSYM